MKFLLIDDDSDDRVLFREALQEVSPDTICATEGDGRKALSNLFNSTTQLPDVIFVDINMPKISGWDCLTQIKSQDKTKDIPVFMYSTSSHDRDIEKASNCGAACLITKPEDFTELKQCLTEIIKLLEDKVPFSTRFASYTF